MFVTLSRKAQRSVVALLAREKNFSLTLAGIEARLTRANGAVIIEFPRVENPHATTAFGLRERRVFFRDAERKFAAEFVQWAKVPRWRGN